MCWVIWAVGLTVSSSRSPPSRVLRNVCLLPPLLGRDPLAGGACVLGVVVDSHPVQGLALLCLMIVEQMDRKQNEGREMYFLKWQDYFIPFFIHTHAFIEHLLCRCCIDNGATETDKVLVWAHRRNSFTLFYHSIQRGKTAALQQVGSLMYPIKFPGVSSFHAPNYLTCSKQTSLFMFNR